MKLIEAIKTWQGEGPDSGLYCTLIRFKECNYLNDNNPCPWCDTIIKMKTSHVIDYNIDYIKKLLDETNGLIITGGEPTLYINEISELFSNIYPYYKKPINIETNGYQIEKLVDIIPLLSDNVKIIYSPKFHVNGTVEKVLNIASKLCEEDIYPNIYFKFVMDDNPSVLLTIKSMLEISSTYLRHRIWLMPKGKTMEEIKSSSLKTLNICKQFNINFSSRNHILFDFS